MVKPKMSDPMLCAMVRGVWIVPGYKADVEVISKQAVPGRPEEVRSRSGLTPSDATPKTGTPQFASTSLSEEMELEPRSRHGLGGSLASRNFFTPLNRSVPLILSYAPTGNDAGMKPAVSGVSRSRVWPTLMPKIGKLVTDCLALRNRYLRQKRLLAVSSRDDG